MKKVKVLLLVLLGGVFVLSGCVSTKGETPAETTEVIPEKKAPTKVEVVQEPEPEPEIIDPPNVVFAKKLQIELENRNIKGAIALFDEIPEELKDDKDLRILLSSLYYSDGQFEKALEVANLVLLIDPDNVDLLELISLCNHALGNKEGYKAASDRILAVDPYNASVNIQKAEDYALTKKYKKARDYYQQALKGNPKNEEALFGYGQMSYYLDDVKTATRTFEKILDIDPKNPSALSYMGKIYGENENYLQASKYIKAAIDVDPYNYDYWMDYGSYLRYQGKFSEAEECWKHAASLDPTYFLAYAYLAGNYDDRNMYEEALENYHMVIKTNPKYYFAYEETAILEYHLGNYESSIKYFNKAYEYSNNYSYKLMNFASYTKLGDSLKAKNELTPLLKTLDKNSIEYAMVRFFYESYSKNAETNLIGKISKEENSTKRGKMLFYFGLYCELNKADTMANEYYSKVVAMQAPMFFEYRIAEWSLGL